MLSSFSNISVSPDNRNESVLSSYIKSQLVMGGVMGVVTCCSSELKDSRRVGTRTGICGLSMGP